MPFGARGPKAACTERILLLPSLLQCQEGKCGVFLCLVALSVMRRSAAGSRDLLSGVCCDAGKWFPVPFLVGVCTPALTCTAAPIKRKERGQIKEQRKKKPLSLFILSR